VQAGDEVQANQLLAEIDATVQTSRVESDRAQLQNLRSQLADRIAQRELAATQATRQEQLMAIGGTSKAELDSAHATLKSAEAQVRSTQAQIAQSQSVLQGDEATLGYSKIYAPIAGTVSSITAREGQTLNANQSAPTILQIADLDVMTVSAQVSEADIPNLRVGMDSYFTTLGNPQRRWAGKLRQILPTPQVVNNVVMYTALFDVDNPDHELMTQMTAQVFFVMDAAYNAVTVPVAALTYLDRGAGRNRGGAGRAGGAGGENAAPANQGEAPVAAGGAGRGGQNAARAGGNAPAAAGAQQQAEGQGARGGFGRRGGGQGQVAAGEGQGQVAGGGFGRRAQGGAARGRTRPATVTVVHEDGTQEVRRVMAGVSDRIKVEVVSGLEEGEQVTAGELRAEEDDGNRGGGRGGGGGFGGFGGRGFGGAP
jgi:macrolide-specific efflux system membrane fusion protein